MASTTSFLSTITGRLKAFFDKLLPIAQKITQGAVVAEPIVDLALAGAGQPAAAALYNSVSAAAVSAETAAAAAASQTGTGTQKAAAVLSDPTVQAAFATFEAAVGVTPHSTTQQLAYVNAVVATLNTLNGTPASPAPAPASGVAVNVTGMTTQAAA